MHRLRNLLSDHGAIIAIIVAIIGGSWWIQSTITASQIEGNNRISQVHEYHLERLVDAEKDKSELLERMLRSEHEMKTRTNTIERNVLLTIAEHHQ